MAADAREVMRALVRWGEAREWLGPDPYEGLNSPLGRLARGKKPRQAVIQAYKRLPAEPPPGLRAKPRPNAKTVALVLSAYASDAGAEFPHRDRWLRRLREQLDALDLRDGPGSRSAAWGYHFDFQSRWSFYSSTTPNAIATSFVVGALMDAGFAEAALGARRFALDELWVDSGSPYFGYVPHDPPLVHNASVLIAGVLARLHSVDPSDEAASRIAAATRTTLAAQNDDGSWPYGAAGTLGWVDNFHTAYNLDGLLCVQRARIEVDGLGAAIDAGAAFWKTRMFEDDARPRYYPDALYPLDAHSYATAVEVLCELGDRDFALRVFDAAVGDLWLPDEGRFAFQRTARGLNKRTFVRWTNAPMLRALCRLVEAQAPGA